MTSRVAGHFHYLNPTAQAWKQRMACCGDWLGCCSPEHGWEGFGESGYHVGSGSERTAWAITLSSVGSPPLVMGFSLSHPSSESRVMTELVRPRQRRKNTRDQSWRHLQAGVRRGVEQRHLRGPSYFLFLMATVSASSVLWIPCKPQLLLRAKGCASPGTTPLIVRTLRALSSPYPLLGDVHLHRHCVLRTASWLNSLFNHIVPPALDMMFLHPWCLHKPP